MPDFPIKIIDVPCKPIDFAPALPVAGLSEGVVVFSLEQLDRHVPKGWPWRSAVSGYFRDGGGKVSLRLYPEIPGTTVDTKGRPLDFGTLDNVKPAGGHCCRAFTIYWTFEDLVVAYRAALDGKVMFERPATGVRTPLPDDILTIGPMVRLVGVCSENPLTGEKFPEPRKVWRCAHQRVDFTCAIYDRRPQMCRRYPSAHHSSRCRFIHCRSFNCPGWTTMGLDDKLAAIEAQPVCGERSAQGFECTRGKGHEGYHAQGDFAPGSLDILGEHTYWAWPDDGPAVETEPA